MLSRKAIISIENRGSLKLNFQHCFKKPWNLGMSSKFKEIAVKVSRRVKFPVLKYAQLLKGNFPKISMSMITRIPAVVKNRWRVRWEKAVKIMTEETPPPGIGVISLERLGYASESAKVLRWEKKIGDKIEPEDLIAVVADEEVLYAGYNT